MPSHPKSVLVSAFKGLNNVISPDGLDQAFLTKADNIDIDKLGGITKRKGYIKVDSGSYTSIWASDNNLGCYAVKDGKLVEILNNYSTIELSSEVIQDAVSFEEVDNLIYIISDSFSGIIDSHYLRPIGMPSNNHVPVLHRAVGGMEEGDYMVTYTLVSPEGKEGGAGAFSTISLEQGEGIRLSLPINPNIAYYRVYCTTPNGNQLYFSKIAVSGETITITDSRNLVVPIKTFGLHPAPSGHIVKYYRGRLYIAQDNILWYSEPFQYELFNLANNYFEFPSKIIEIMPVEDGIWIGADRLYYLSGEDAITFKRATKEYVKIVEGTATKVSGSYLHLDNTPVGYKWLVCSDLGIWVLFNQGLNINLTSQNISLESADSGTAIFLQNDGMNRYLSILKTNENPNNSAMGDLVETTIIRNGVIIP